MCQHVFGCLRITSFLEMCVGVYVLNMCKRYGTCLGESANHKLVARGRLSHDYMTPRYVYVYCSVCCYMLCILFVLIKNKKHALV